MLSLGEKQWIRNLFDTKQLHLHFDIIGRGSKGVVYGHKEKPYAIKVYQPEFEEFIFENDFQDPIFLKELQGHPCFPKLFDYVEHCYMVVERIEGVTVEQWNPEMPLAEDWRVQLVDSLKYCLEKGIFPDDVGEPSNIMIRKNGNPVIVDVGWFCFDRYTQIFFDKLLNQFKRIHLCCLEEILNQSKKRYVKM